MRVIAICLILIQWLAASASSWAAEPANPNANAKARALLKYLENLKGRPSKRLLSGQFTAFGDGASLRLLEKVHERTGHWPALMGVDYADFPRGSLTWKKPNAAAIEYWRQGGLVTVSAHLYDPANPSGGGLRDAGVNLDGLLAAGSPTHRRWLEELDRAAAGLQELQQSGVVVLWRPFHEMNGGWFWWGAKDPQSFIKLWRQTFDYLTHAKGLNNLLWVYSPNHGPNTAAYFPGANYVDVAGLDAYTDFVDPQHVKGFPEVAALGKPFGFAEFGPHGSSHPPGDYDYRRFLDGVSQHFAAAVFFMCWNDNWSLASNQHTRQLLNDPRIVNREDLPKGLFRD